MRTKLNLWKFVIPLFIALVIFKIILLLCKFRCVPVSSYKSGTHILSRVQCILGLRFRETGHQISWGIVQRTFIWKMVSQEHVWPEAYLKWNNGDMCQNRPFCHLKHFPKSPTGTIMIFWFWKVGPLWWEKAKS